MLSLGTLDLAATALSSCSGIVLGLWWPKRERREHQQLGNSSVYPALRRALQSFLEVQQLGNSSVYPQNQRLLQSELAALGARVERLAGTVPPSGLWGRSTRETEIGACWKALRRLRSAVAAAPESVTLSKEAQRIESLLLRSELATLGARVERLASTVPPSGLWGRSTRETEIGDCWKVLGRLRSAVTGTGESGALLKEAQRIESLLQEELRRRVRAKALEALCKAYRKFIDRHEWVFSATELIQPRARDAEHRRAVEEVQVDISNRCLHVSLPAPIRAIIRAPSHVAGTRGRPRLNSPRGSKHVVAEYARNAVDLIFRTTPEFQNLAISVIARRIEAKRGHEYRACVLSAIVDRQEWAGIVHANVTAEAAFSNFPFRFRYNRNFELEEVIPFNVSSKDAHSAQTEKELSLSSLDPVRFEALVRDLLAAIGFRAVLTKASGDGGIDVEAMNPQPIVGGKIIVQCKRYSGTIGSPVVRDLYGTLMDARAGKGILITTSNFSSDALRFAEDKPIELINGQQLVELLQQHGVRVRLD